MGAVQQDFLSVRDLFVNYETSEANVHAVNGVSFNLEKGKTLALVGETGAGKTTIARSILRVLPNPPAKIKGGQILFEGKNLLELPEDEMRRVRGSKITMIFQDPMTALNPVMYVGDQIAEVVEEHGESKAQARKRAIEMLETVGIPAERYEEYPHQFSGGMRQRVVIAIALACSPGLLLADEPTTALDVTIQAQVLDLMRKLNSTLQTSMLLITHDLGVVAEMCDDVAIVYAGQILEIGSKEDIFDHPAHPYTLGLFGAIPEMDTDSERLSPISGFPPDPTDLPGGCCFNPRCPQVRDECRNATIGMAEISQGHFCRCLNVKESNNANPG
ncbi:dipeptide/oligopeptide/nickel ABC transporter ATP-binding protein [Spirochaetia bacterium]|nr:dipeptide/oligopeptide/nickel ABC transporter ATP-binding protein [Spirochaetia bacterium]